MSNNINYEMISGIKMSAFIWNREHGNFQIFLDLLLSVITISLQMVDIVAGLPNVEWL